MKICLQGAAFDTNNNGVGALAVGSVRAILHRYPDAEVFFLNYEKLSTTYTLKFPDRQVSVPLVNMRFSWRFWLGNNIAFLLFLTVLMKLLPFRSLKRRWIAGSNCLRHLDESDLVVAISGGDSFSDIYGMRRLIYVSLPQILALWAGKRLILLPQTLGPYKSRLARAIAKYIMDRAEAVYTRDYAGLRLGGGRVGSQESGAGNRSSESQIPNPKSLAGRVRFCYDVGFVLDPLPPERVDIVGLNWPRCQDCRLVGLNVSGLLAATDLGRYNDFGLKADYGKLVDKLIEYFIEKKGAQVLLIPHVFATRGESDSVYCEKVYQGLTDKYRERIGLVRGRYDQSEIKYIIGQCGFFIGSRMHACIAAVSQCIPAVSIAYSDKFIGVMETLGVEALVADARNMNEDEILRIVDQAFERRALVRRQLEQKMPQVKKGVLGLFDEIAGAKDSVGAGTSVAAVTAGE